MSHETYRVEIRFARQGWFVVIHHGREARGLSARTANAVAAEWRELQDWYAALGARRQRIRVVRESDNKALRRA